MLTEDSQCVLSVGSESPVTQDRPRSPVRGHKILEPGAGQPQDMGTSL